MDHDDAPVGLIYSRRDVLNLGARTGMAVAFVGGAITLARPGIAAPPVQKANLIASPAMTDGPFFTDKKPIRSNLLAGTNREAVIKGLPLSLDLKVLKLAQGEHSPLVDAEIDIWHCDAVGVYSDVEDPRGDAETRKAEWLRGRQITNAEGRVKFETIIPGWYPGRAPHIHFKVRKSNGAQTADFSSQLFFNSDVIEKAYAKPPYASHGPNGTSNNRDGIFSSRMPDGAPAGSQLMLDLKPAEKGFKAHFVIVLTDRSFRQTHPDLDWAAF